MFTKGSKDSGVLSAAFQKVPAPPSLLAADLLITGDIVSAGEIQIDGRVNGNIQSDVLVVGESAQITGEIRAENVRIHGHVNGQIKARTVSLAIYDHVQALEYGAANRTALLLVAFSFLVLVFTYGMQRRPWSPVSGR